MKRRLLLTCIALLVVGPVAVAGVLLHTEAALRWVLAAVQQRSGGTLHIGAASGTLSGPVTLHDVSLKNAAFTLRIERLDVEWTPLALLVNRLDLHTVQARHVSLILTPAPGTEHGHFEWPVPPRLPFTVVVQELRADDLQLAGPRFPQPLRVARLEAGVRLDNRAWQVSRLMLNGEQIQAQGHADWLFSRNETLDAALHWDLSLPGQPRLAGDAQLRGNAQLLKFGMNLTAPVQLRFDADIHTLSDTPSWQGTLRLQRAQPGRYLAALRDTTLQGTASFSGTPAATSLNGSVQAQAGAGNDWHGQFVLRYTPAQLEVRQLELARAASDTRFRLHGRIDLTGTRAAPDLEGDWRDLHLPLTGKTRLSSPHGTLSLQTRAQRFAFTLAGALSQGGKFTAHGTINPNVTTYPWQLSASAQRFHLQLDKLPGPLPAFDWQLAARGDRDVTRIEALTLQVLGGTLLVHGRYTRADTPVWHATLEATHLDPGLLYSGFPGDLAFEATLDGQQGPAPSWHLQLHTLHGTLNKAPLSISGRAQYVQGRLRFDKVTGKVADNRFQFDGHVGRNTHVAWDIAAPRLADLWPGLGGALESRGSVLLDDATPRADFTLHATDLHYRDFAAASVAARVAMSGKKSDGNATLVASGVRVKGETFRQLEAHAEGTLAAHAVALQLDSSLGKAAFAGHGALANDVWHGDLQTVTLQPQGAGVWHNATAWQPRIGTQGLILPQACVVQASARACLDASWHDGQWRARATSSRVPLHVLQAWLPAGLEYSGTFDATLKANGDPAQHQLDLSAELSPGSIHNTVRHRRVALLDYTRGTAHIHVGTDLTTGNLNWSLRDGGFLTAETRIVHGDKPALSGRIRGELHDFALIPALIPAVGDFRGRFDIALTLGGTPADPTFTGTASLLDGALQVPRLGLDVRDVVLHLDGNGTRLALDGSARSGSGTLDWHSSALKQHGTWHAQGSLAGQGFRAVDIPEAQVDISPHLDFTLDGRDITLDGAVAVPYAKLRPRNLSDAVQVSEDQVIVGQNEAAQRDRWHIHSRVRVTMGEHVDFAGFGLSGRITGSVVAVDEPGHFTTGSGELQIVDGRYMAYGQKLAIRNGRLMFNGGPISNPALDIRALRAPAHPETVLPGQSEQQVGVTVRGTLHDPAISLFSNPPLPQSALLSYLLTGQLPATPSQSPLLGSPGTDTGDALKYSGGEFLAQQIGEQIGLGDVSIQNVSTGSGTSTPSLFIGRYLSPRLYVSYGAGLLQSLNTIRIRYTLGSKWVLEAESGAASSADIIYTLEH